MIAEAIDTAVALGWALAAWIVVLAATATLLALATVAGVGLTARAVWRALTAAVRAVQALRAHSPAASACAPPQAPYSPAWARTGKDAA